MANLSKLSKNLPIYLALSGVGAAGFILAYGLGFSQRKKTTTAKTSSSDDYQEIDYMIKEQKEKNKTKNKVEINLEFFRSIFKIVKILIPKFWSYETGILTLMTVVMMSRPLTDIWTLKQLTELEFFAIRNKKKEFKSHLILFLTLLPLFASLSSTLTWCVGKLHLRFRTNLTNYAIERYLNELTYYKISNLDTRIQNSDQLMTNDVDKFCSSLIDFYVNISKPFFTICVCIPMVTIGLGFKPAQILLPYLLIAGSILTLIRRPLSILTYTEQKLEGEYRYVNSRLITNSEEVAFYYGNKREKLTVLSSYIKLLRFLKKFLNFQIGIDLLDSLMAKHFAEVAVRYAVTLPFFTDLKHLDFTKRQVMYYTTGQILLKIALAVGEIVMAGRDLSKLAGFTGRIKELIHVLNEVNAGRYKRTMINSNDETSNEKTKNHLINGGLTNGLDRQTIEPNKGIIKFENNVIKFDKVPLVTPNGDILIKELTFEVKSGMNVLVCGPNGCGKSSLFRTLGELWPLWGGELIKPPRGKLFYVPQKPYMTLGTLRDQIIYPHTLEDMMKEKKTDSDLLKFLEIVQLKYLKETRADGLNSVDDWIDVLSGGEKQRIAMARLFYHNPQFAILDECTSAVSVDVEGLMYKYCCDANITLFTVSHRKSLWEHHEYYLQFDGKGNYKFGPIDDSIEEFGS